MNPGVLINTLKLIKRERKLTKSIKGLMKNATIRLSQANNDLPANKVNSFLNQQLSYCNTKHRYRQSAHHKCFGQLCGHNLVKRIARSRIHTERYFMRINLAQITCCPT